MQDLITMNTLEVAKDYNFKDERLALATSQILNIYSSAVEFAETKNREIASILSRVKSERSYVKDGYKSVADYAQQIFGIKKQSAYALATAGDIYNDESASDALKSFSPSKLAEVANVNREILEDHISHGIITPTTTQKDLRDFAKHNTEADESKVKIADMFTARVVSIAVPDLLARRMDTPRILEDWNEIFCNYIMDVSGAKRAPEVIKLPKCSPNSNPNSKKKTVIRYLYITENYTMAVEFYKAIAPKKGNAMSKPKYTIEQLRAMLEEMEAAQNNVEDEDAEEGEDEVVEEVEEVEEDE